MHSSSSSQNVRPLEQLEPRWLMANPVLADIDDAAFPGGKSIILPLNASDADGGRITYTVTSSDSNVKARLHTGNPHLRLTVEGYGTMTFELLRDVAPRTVDHIAALVQAGFYDGLKFHRVIDNFMIQGGDPSGNGSGGPEYQIDDEFHPNAIFTGIGQLAMAKSSDDTNGSQFFITESSPRHLDFNHTIFGQLVRGLGVLRDIAAVDTVTNDVPSTPVIITKAELIENKTDAVVTLVSKKAGNATITVIARDEDGNTDERTFTATAGATDTVNQAPILQPIGTQYINVNQQLKLPIEAFDLEGDQYYVWGQLLSPNFAATVEGTTVIVTPNKDFTGALKLSVGVSAQPSYNLNPYGGARWDTQALTIVVGDRPITAWPVGVAAAAGQAATLRVASFIDADPGGTAAQYSAEIRWGDGKKSSGTIFRGGDGRFYVEGGHTFTNAGNYPVRVIITDPGGATADVLTPAVVSDGSPIVSAGPDQAISEGGTLTQWGSFAGTGAWTATVDYGDGSDEQPVDHIDGRFTLNYGYDDDGTYTVTVTLSDGTNTITDTYEVIVAPKAPVAAPGGDKDGVPGQPRTLTLAAVDGSSADEAAGFKFQIDWGDGSPLVKTSKGTAAVTHAFAGPGRYRVRVRAIDQDGLASAWEGRNTIIAAAQLQKDPWDTSKQALVVGGSDASDKISVTPKGSKLRVTIGKALVGTFAATGRIIAFGNNGNDSITIDAAITRDAELRGGTGNDQLRGGGGHDLLIGDKGRDLLVGNGGRDLLIGGIGADALTGGGDEDLLIAGSTKYDGASSALERIMQAWTGEADYETRIDSLLAGGGVLGSVRLSGTKVRGDADVDVLTGSAGTDAFWLNVKGTKDKAKDRATDETRTKLA